MRPRPSRYADLVVRYLGARTSVHGRLPLPIPPSCDASRLCSKLIAIVDILRLSCQSGLI